MSKKDKKAPACTPQSWEEADKLMAEYGEIDATLTHNQADCETAVAKVMATYQKVAEPLEARKAEIFEAIYWYAAANRKTLTDDGKTKTVTMTAGAFGWRTCPSSVAFAKGLKAADIIANIRTLLAALKKKKADPKTPIHAAAARMFIRVKLEPNKEAMRNAPETAVMVEGVKIVTDQEEFFVDPTIAELPEPK